MALLKFFRGNKAKYNATVHADCVFFALDTKEILMNGNSFGLHSAGPGKGIQSVTYTAPNKITINYTSGAPDVVTLQNAEAGSSVATSKGGLMTPEQAYKLENISSGGFGNGLSGVSVDGVDLVPVNGKVDIDTTTLRVEAKDATVEVTSGSKQGGTATKTKVGVKLGKKANNILQTDTDGLYASLEVKKSTSQLDLDRNYTSYQLQAIKPDGSVYDIGTAMDFIEHPYLNRTKVVEIPQGKPDAGKQGIHFSYIRPDGTSKDEYIAFPTSGGSPGNGLEIGPDGKIKLKLDASTQENIDSNGPLFSLSDKGLEATGLVKLLTDMRKLISRSFESLSWYHGE